MKVAILYGFGEGDYHGRAFVRKLREAGFDVVRQAKDADIVITHSGGCFFMPPLDHQKFVIINPPYWPGKSLSVSTIQKVSIDFIDFARDGKILQWFWKTTVNLVHVFRYIFKTLTITLHAHRKRFYEALRDENTIIIRSSHDTFLSPDAEQLLEAKTGHSVPLYTLPGHHDSCWRNPDPYIKLIKQFAYNRKIVKE